MILRNIKKQAYEKKTRKSQTSPLKMLRKSNYEDIFIQSFFYRHFVKRMTAHYKISGHIEFN